MIKLKNNLSSTSLFSRASVAVVLTFFFVAGFLGSRAILSIATLLLGANALRGTTLRQWLPQRGWWLMVAWVAAYALSIVQGGDTELWGAHVQVKLPFLVLPLAWAFPLSMKRVHWNALAGGLCLLFLSGVVWSLSKFLPQAEAILKGYGQSHTLRTPVYNNHICFSAALAAMVLLCGALWDRMFRGTKILCAIASFVFVGYLHLLAAKTGLVMLYLIVLFWAARLLYCRQWKPVFVLLLVAVGAVGAAYKWVPTFATRIGYMRYSFEQYRAGKASGNYSDPARLYSYRVASKIIQQRPLAGWGAGNLITAMDKGYTRWNPRVAAVNRLVPHNQFLASAVVVGVPATALLFVWWLGFPLRLRRNKEGYWAAVGWAALSVLLFVDPAFEIQFGIAVFLLFAYWFKNLSSDPPLAQ